MNPTRGSRDILDAFWRAAAYCLHPKVVLLSIAPLLVVGAAAAALGFYYWEPTVAAMRESLESWSVLGSLSAWLESVGLGGLRSVIAPLLIVALAVPLFIVTTLFVVAVLMTPAIVRLVASRRFPDLARGGGANFLQSLVWSLGCTVLALLALIVSIPLWFVPPLVLILPPLIWGWLTYRVLAFDVLAEFALRKERVRLLQERRWELLGMGVAAGALGAAPSLLWAVSALALFLAPLLILVSIWLYTLVFAFSSLWFAHYLLAALDRLRAEENAALATVGPPLPPGIAPALRAPEAANGLAT